MAKPWRPRLTVFAGLHDKHQVKAIAKHLGLLPDHVIGPLIRIWFKFQCDATEAGELKGKTAAWLDTLAGCPGFAAAMAAAHWLYIYHDRLQIPAFDEFVSKKAVLRIERALDLAGRRAVGSAGCAGDKPHITAHKSTQEHKVPVEPVAPKVRPPRVATPGPLFDRFWAAYPRKKCKADAARAWVKLGEVSEELLVRMVAAVGWQSRSDQWVKDNGQFIPHPATWLNRRQWEDEPVAVGAGQPVLGPGRVPAAEGKYGKRRSYGEADPGDVPGGGSPGLFEA